MTDHHSRPLENVLRWLHKGYPEGVPPKDYSRAGPAQALADGG